MTATGSTLLFLELNEVNFDFIRGYIDKGELPAFRRLIEQHGYALTGSEREYSQLEPWIQWVTAHTGMTLAEHGVYRLGDIVNHDIPQIWEELESRGVRVGAMSPMNAKNRLKEPAFFVPDPWTPTTITAGPTLCGLYRSIVQMVGDNAKSRITAKSLVNLLRGFMVYAAPGNWSHYFSMARSASGNSWRKAMFLDLLLADVFAKEVRRTRPAFASLFLNAAAHIQHHYLFSSPVYRGECRNPGWYLPQGVDPLLEVYRLYDRVVERTQRQFPEARLMIGTGLHQEPHGKVTYYWRLRDHAAFLRKIGVEFTSVAALMSRDFLVSCKSDVHAVAAQRILEAARAKDCMPLFEVDNRGHDLFVMLTYPREIGGDDDFSLDGKRFARLADDVVFVALKNGEHDGVGYFMDTGRGRQNPQAPPIRLSELPGRILEAVLGSARA